MMSCSDSLLVEVSENSSFLELETVFGKMPKRLELDVGCGKGRFLIARALANPETSFIGIDKKKARVLKVKKKTERSEVSNIRLLCAEAMFVISDLIPTNSVSSCYIFFPDPWPKRRHHRRRLFDETFMNAMDRTLVMGGAIHIATDHFEYFEVIHSTLSADARFREIPPFVPGEEERTEFELVFRKLNASIYSCSFEKQ